MARRLFLHIGTPKTGTTYLQRVLWANEATLREQQMLLPLKSVHEHFFLSVLARAAERPMEKMPAHGHTAWQRMLAEVADWPHDVLISHELFSACTPERARWTTDQLASVSGEVHVVVTARDLARQVPAEWQQTLKHGRSHRLRKFYAELRSDEPTVLFWQVQDLPRLLGEWAEGVPASHVHIVTVPPVGAPDDLLWRRFATLVGVDPGSVELPDDLPNKSLGVVEAETLRRVNSHQSQEEHSTEQFLIRSVLADGVLVARPGATRFASPVDEHPWVVQRGTEMVAELRRSPYDVVGDLDELLPAAEPVHGPVPDDVSDSDVATVAVETISDVLYRTHEYETARLTAQLTAQRYRIQRMEQRARALVDRGSSLQQRVRTLEQRAQTLEQQLATARKALREERGLPLKVHLRRKAGRVKRRVLRQPLP